MSRSGLIGIGLAVCIFAAVGVVSASCIDTSGLAGGAPLETDSAVDTGPANPDPCGKDLQNDLANCGTCGNVCGFGANSFPLCTAGACTIGCNTQFGNCDNNDKNGCETALAGDPANCNACGRDCGGGTCTTGQCGPVNLAPKIDAGLDNGYPVSLAIDGTSIFYGWYNQTAGAYDIVKLDKVTGAAQILASGATFYQQLLAADSDPNGFLYFVRPWTNYYPSPVAPPPYATPTSADGAILQLAKNSPDGGIQTPTVFAGSSAQGVAGGIFADSNTTIVATSTGIYFNTYGSNFYNGESLPYIPLGAGVWKCPLTGTCNPEQLAPNEYGAYSLALDGAGFAFDNAQTATVFTCPLVGCPASPTVLQTSASSHAMSVDAANYYWIDNSNDSIDKADRTSNTVTPLATGQLNPYALAIDDKNVYWVGSNNPGTLSECAIAGCGGAPTVLVQNLTAARAVAVDATAVYWISETTGGSVFKVVK